MEQQKIQLGQPAQPCITDGGFSDTLNLGIVSQATITDTERGVATTPPVIPPTASVTDAKVEDKCDGEQPASLIKV